MWPKKSESMPEDLLSLNPYESFMRKHLQHYGYYTSRNKGFSFSTGLEYDRWERSNDDTQNSDSSGSESDCDLVEVARHDPDEKFQDDLQRTTQVVYNVESGKIVPRLKEPRELYAITTEPGLQSAPRWPADIQVVETRIKHMHYIPPEPEPFYHPTGLERMPMVREENGGRIVYHHRLSSSFFVCSRVGGARNSRDDFTVKLESVSDRTLLFESRFESGNLAKAVQIAPEDYELWLANDLYTCKHTQWFYFRVSNTRKNVPYRFTIVNLMKSDSLYNSGMKPLMCSMKNVEEKNIGWIRTGYDIKYYKNNKLYVTHKGENSYYSLTWTVELPYDTDMVYFAHCYPYTYTDVQDYLAELMNDPVKSKICKQRVLCRTVAGNLIYVLTITSPSQNHVDLKHKKGIVLTARVHPGESNASWIMKGFLDYLTGDTADAKIVPMLNPDGVIVGNYRCSLAGRDLNRNYRTSLKDCFPSVWHTRNMIKKLLSERDVVLYCDIHGHSRKQNVFIYGCENRSDSQKFLKERIFPVILSRNAPDKFSFSSCKFKIQKSKEGTGRILMWKMGIVNSYTLEATFCGSTIGSKKGHHFSIRDYEAMGYHFCDTLLDYCDPDQTKCFQVMSELEENLRQTIRMKLERQGINPDEINLTNEYMAAFESSDCGSDSSVSDGLPIHLQFQSQRIGMKKKLKTKKERDIQRMKNISNTESRPSEKKNPEVVNRNKNQTLQYTVGSVKQPRPRPIFISNFKENSDKKDTPYLEKLTNMYLRTGQLLTNSQGGPPPQLQGEKMTLYSTMPINSKSLPASCEHTLTKEYMSQPAQNLHAAKFFEEMKKNGMIHLRKQILSRGMYHSSSAGKSKQDLGRIGRSYIKQHPNPFDELQLSNPNNLWIRNGSNSASQKKSLPMETNTTFNRVHSAVTPSLQDADFLSDAKSTLDSFIKIKSREIQKDELILCTRKTEVRSVRKPNYKRLVQSVINTPESSTTNEQKLSDNILIYQQTGFNASYGHDKQNFFHKTPNLMISSAELKNSLVKSTGVRYDPYETNETLKIIRKNSQHHAAKKSDDSDSEDEQQKMPCVFLEPHHLAISKVEKAATPDIGLYLRKNENENLNRIGFIEEGITRKYSEKKDKMMDKPKVSHLKSTKSLPQMIKAASSQLPP